MSPWIGLAIVGVAALAVGYVLWTRNSEPATEHAIRTFRHRREALEAKFFDLASSQGKPRGLRWTHCDWREEVRFARDLESGLLTAFAGVQIHFEAIEGSDMEDVEAVGHFREASAVFHYKDGNWGTGGKALFNMLPEEAVTRLVGQFEPVESPSETA